MKINTLYNIPNYKNIEKQTNPIEVKNATVEKSIEFVGYYYPHFKGAKNLTLKHSVIDTTFRKQKLLKTFSDILATNKPVLSAEEIATIMAKRAHNFMISRRKKLEALYAQIKSLKNDTKSKLQEKYSRGRKIYSEIKFLKGRVPNFNLEELLNQKPSEEYDYVLISKFKSAITDDYFNLKKIFDMHYSGLASLQSISELKEKYHGIKTPQTPAEIISARVLNSLGREFYEELERRVQIKDEQESFAQMRKLIEPIFVSYATLSSMDTIDFVEKVGPDISNAIFNNFLRIKEEYGDFNTIPKEINKKKVLPLSDIDKKMLQIDFDNFVLYVIRQLYTEGKSFNEITYHENNVEINLSELKNSDYKFEKVSEKIKKIIKDAMQARATQQKYENYNSEDFVKRLSYFAQTDAGLNDFIFNKLVDFERCRFTDEDISNLIILLKELDKLQDKEIDEESVVKKFKLENISPIGTEKLNELEDKETIEQLQKEEIEAKIKLEKEREDTLRLKFIRKDFEEAINKLFQSKMPSIAISCSKYCPESLGESELRNARIVMQIIDDNLETNKERLANLIMQKEIYEETLKDDPTSEILAKGKLFAQNYPKDDFEFNVGLYLLSREIVEDYPDCLSIVDNPKLVEKIIEKSFGNKDIATNELCKYRLYSTLDDTEKSLILKITEIFDKKDPIESEIIEYIIKNNYVHSDTITRGLKGFSTPPTIGLEAKKEILDKYGYPNCMNYFIAFEEALYQKARANNTAGIKRLTGDITSLYDYELKITGHPDRLFASKNDFRFDIFSQEGLH